MKTINRIIMKRISLKLGLLLLLFPFINTAAYADTLSSPNFYKFTAEQIKSVQTKLLSLKYNPGTADGLLGQNTRNAIVAYEKQNDLHIDGVLDTQVFNHIMQANENNVCMPQASRDVNGYLTQIDLTKQVMSVFKENVLLRIVPISSASGKNFRHPDGHIVKAITPTGHFTAIRHLKGVHHSYLGVLYNPVYITDTGIAVHGEPEVPYYPASHGCIRIPMIDSVWFESIIPLGSDIDVENTFAETGNCNN